MSTLDIFLSDPILAHAPPLPAFRAESMRSVYRLDVVDEGPDAKVLEEAFRIFNIQHPSDYRERSLSIGDVVTINHNRSYRCDWIGWERLERPVLVLDRMDTKS